MCVGAGMMVVMVVCVGWSVGVLMMVGVTECGDGCIGVVCVWGGG